MTDLKARLAAQFPRIQDDLADLVRIPSISNSEFDQAFVSQSAQRVLELFQDAGADRVGIYHAPRPDGSQGAPAVIAHFDPAPGAPTVMLYAHHDVQPIPDKDEWHTEPFEPVVEGERMFGRGAADDKAGITLHLGALRALGADRRVGVTVFIEGEEEVGSPSFVTFLNTHHELLKADVIVVADSGNWAVGQPALTTSLRGLVTATVELRVLDHAVHSGMWSGPIIDANILMSRLVATLHHDDGSLAVAGLHVADEPTVDYSEAELRADSGMLPSAQFAGTGTLTGRMWTKPAISLIGWDAVRVASASNTLAPAARIALSLRIPAGQDPQAAYDALAAHLQANAPMGAQVVVTCEELGQAFASPASSPAMDLARWAFNEAWGVAPVDMGVGGSIPFIAELLSAFPQAEILVTGVEDPDSRAHGANESLHLGDWRKAMLAEVLLLDRLGENV